MSCIPKSEVLEWSYTAREWIPRTTVRRILMELMEKLTAINLPSDAAAFVCEWYPEAECYADEILRCGAYSWLTFAVFSEEEWASHLDWFDTSEEEYEERYGIVFRDAAFEGVLVIGE